jgi:predicted dehydrogenase
MIDMVQRSLRVGVIGAGRLGGFHAQKLANNPDVELIGVADPHMAAGKRVAQECGTESFADPTAMLDFLQADELSLDAVVVAAPSLHHHAIGMECLRRGIHVLMEKPLARTTREADELLHAASANGAVLQVGHVERFNPATRTAFPHLDSPRLIEATRTSGFTFRSMDIGVVLDLMIHDIDLVLSLNGSPIRRVAATGMTLMGGHEDVAHARIEFTDGCVAVLHASRVSHTAARRMRVLASNAMATIDFAARRTELVRPSQALLDGRLGSDSLSPEELERLKSNLHDEHLPLEIFEDDAVDALTLEQSEFFDAIRTNRFPRVSGREGRDAVALAHAILDDIQRNASSEDDDSDPLVDRAPVPFPGLSPAPGWNIISGAPSQEEDSEAARLDDDDLDETQRKAG